VQPSVPLTPEVRAHVVSLATPLGRSPRGVLDILMRRHATPLCRSPRASTPVIP
jgi:hypothetical protein